MPLRISCPEGHTLVVSQARAGSTLCCPKCSARIVIPPLPPRSESLADATTTSLSQRQPATGAIALAEREPQPPPIVAPCVDAAPPPVWSPPPKSRAIVEPQRAGHESVPAQLREEPNPNTPQPSRNPIAASEPATEAAPAAPVKPQVVAEVTQIPVPRAKDHEPIPAKDLRQGEKVASGSTFPPAPDTIHDDPPLVPSAGQQFVAYALSFSLAAAALFGATPAIWESVQVAQAAEGALVSRWALALIAVGLVQLAYAVYLAQLPDWTSGWTVTIVSLALAALYAAMLGITLLASADSFLIRGLDLGEIAPSGRAAMWCLCMTSILTTLAFFAGRTSFRWRAAEEASGPQLTGQGRQKKTKTC